MMLYPALPRGIAHVFKEGANTMANFDSVSDNLLKHIPQGFSNDWKEVLKRSGTYALFNPSNWALVVPNVENPDGEKGRQARLIGMRGGQDGGHRLGVKAQPEVSGLKVELVSETPVAPHLWLWCVSAEHPQCLVRNIETKLVGVTMVATQGKPVGTIHAGALPVKITPEWASSARLSAWSGGTRDETRDAILDECRRQGVLLDTQVAYILATAQHECNFRPIREGQFGGADPQASERFRRALGYYPYYGRGYVQLTHRGNYQGYGTRLGIDLEHDPDLALQPNVALFVLVHGVMNGSFGAALTRFVNDRQTDFVHARQSVNAMDRAAHIAGIANTWLTWLRTNRPNVFRNPNAHPNPLHPGRAHPAIQAHP
jgi:hypothetical protein